MMMQRTKPVPKIKTVKQKKEIGKTYKAKLQSRRKTKSLRTKLRNDCDKAWSAYIHTRDIVCQKCGSNKLLSAHHLISRINLALRWDEDNGILLCYHCHIQLAHHNPLVFIDWLKGFKGLDWVNNLVLRACETVKFSNKDLEEKLENLRRKTRELND